MQSSLHISGSMGLGLSVLYEWWFLDLLPSMPHYMVIYIQEACPKPQGHFPPSSLPLKKKCKREKRSLGPCQTLFVWVSCLLECFSNKPPGFHIQPFTAKQPSNWEWSVLKSRVSHEKLFVALLAPLEAGRVACTSLLPLLMTFGGKRV